MRQIVLIHGGNSFDSYERYLDNLRSSSLDYERLIKSPHWTDWLSDELPEADVLSPSFPNKQNASFDEWSIYFEKLLPHLIGEVSLVGHSLGGMFLVKYLNDKPLMSKVRQICLLAPAYNDNSLEDLGSFGIESAKNLPASSDDIHLFHSQDDPVVPFTELAKFQADLPGATVHKFTDKSHFFDATFPELLEVLKK